MKRTTATVEILNDRDGTIYANTPDGPFIVGYLGDELGYIEDGQTVVVEYHPQDQWAKIVQ